ncbi:MAG: DedA family protein [Chitinivibrionales bacterium]|nr:DedA family protein [Chitinivibrionales bacterium]
MIEQIFQPVLAWYMDHINYWTIMLLMAIESSFIPLPSEIVIPPAAWKAAQGQLNIYGVIVFGTIGAMIGALFNYSIALFIGRAIVYKIVDTRFMHAMLIDRHKVEKAEKYFIKYGKSSTFIGRLVPVVRHLISVPAGFSRMRLFDFLLFTAAGAMIWNAILAMLGYYLYSQKEVLERYYEELGYACLFLGVVFFGIILFRTLRNPKNQQTLKSIEEK